MHVHKQGDISFNGMKRYYNDEAKTLATTNAKTLTVIQQQYKTQLFNNMALIAKQPTLVYSF